MASNLIGILFTAFLGALSGCSKWPPYEQELTSQFFDSREEIELLVHELQNSKYTSVNTSAGGDIFADYSEGEKWAEGPVSQEEPKDPDKWRRLFTRTGLDNVSETYEGDYALFLDIFFLDRPETEAFISYVNSPTIQTSHKKCAPEFSRSKCGICIVHLDDEWWIRYGWQPVSLLSDLEESDANDQLTGDAYLDEASVIWDACLAQGGTQLKVPDEN